MSIGDFVRFDQFKLDKGKGEHDLSSDEIKFAVIKSAANGGIDPTASLSDPRWGAGGGTNLSSSEVTPGGNYSTGGQVKTCTWTLSMGSTLFTISTALQWLLDAANPTNARWIICYNNTNAGLRAIGYIDLGTDLNMVVGDLKYTADATNGLFTET